MRDVHRLDPCRRARAGAPCSRRGNGSCRARITSRASGPKWRSPGIAAESSTGSTHTSQAPIAVAEIDHTPEHDVVFAELGFCAASVAHDVGNSVASSPSPTPPAGSWPSGATRPRSPEPPSQPGALVLLVRVRGRHERHGHRARGARPGADQGAEHWCQAFHNWVCAGIAVRDVVTREPIAVLNISCWRSQLPAAAGSWLANAVTKTQCTLKRRARNSGAELVAAYTQARARSGAALAAMDTAGKVVIADDTASVLMGVPASTPAVDPTVRWNPGLPELIQPPGMPADRRPAIPTGSARRRSSPTSPTSRRRSASDRSSRPDT